MPPIRVSFHAARREFAAGMRALRAELGVPSHHPPSVQALAARRARGTTIGDRADLRDIPFVAIDPEGSRDLDQAYFGERRGRGYRVRYAIADVAHFVFEGDAIDAEAHLRGVTLYAPDGNAALHPRVLSEGAASLAARSERPALVWRLDLDADGALTDAGLERARVVTREAISYDEAQRRIDAGEGPESLLLLREIGELRRKRERERGGVSVNLPGQEVDSAETGYVLRYSAPRPVERWNAQISLLTGIAAARLMLSAGTGILRTLPPADPEVLASLRRRADALGLAWRDDQSYPHFVGGLSADRAEGAAMLTQSLRALRGAGYQAFDGSPPQTRVHAGVASEYAHVTAPLRRLVDRFSLEAALAAANGRRPPDWVLTALEDLPETMGAARRREGEFERSVVDLAEAIVLKPCVGKRFPAEVVDRNKDRVTVMLREPAIVARTAEGRRADLGDEVTVRVDAADPVSRHIGLTVVDVRP
ncbi:MAG: RNB domain-containing ribonuclease [Miltoncostaeaceae bacterium]